MIQITLPTNQNLLNDLTEPILQDVCSRLFSTTEYDIAYENRRHGRYIKINNDRTDEVHYICFSNPNNNSRNSHLMQFVAPTYVEFYRDNSKNKHLNIFLISPSGNDETNYIKMFYRCFMTIGINVLNLDDLGITEITAFNSYEDLKSYRNQTSGRNTHNRSTYFTDDDKQISIYGKTFGANAMESFIFGLTIRQITEKPVVFYPVLDNESENLSAEQQNILISEGLTYGNSIKLLPTGYAKATRDTSRNTSAFHYNLLQKFGDKQCYLCGCDLEHLIIGAHIERVTDIDHNASYTPDQKAERATDGDNGLWLCANHDKMFEYGIIYFEQYVLRVGGFVAEQSQQNFIEKSIFDTRKIYFDNIDSAVFEVKTEHRSDKMLDYISKHFDRHNSAI